MYLQTLSSNLSTTYNMCSQFLCNVLHSQIRARDYEGARANINILLRWEGVFSRVKSSIMAASFDGASKKLNLVVFGATGRTGKEVVKQALEKGHHVTAIVRTPEKLNIQHENLELVKGDACDVESFAAALDGKDAVLSSLGVYANIFNPTTFYSESMHAITEGMRRYKITRLVTVTSWCTQPGPNNRWLVEWILKPLFLNGVIKDMATMEKMLESSEPEDLNYTIVRSCHLLAGEKTGNYKTEEGQCNTGTTNKITVADVADFMLKTLKSNEYDRKGIAIAGL